MNESYSATQVDTAPLSLNLKNNNVPRTAFKNDLASLLHLKPNYQPRSIHALLKAGITKTENTDEDPFYVADLGEVERQHKKWVTLLPRIKPHFAVKCNPDPMVIQTLARNGTGFDCASKSEIQLVLGLGIDPSRIIYANPCKQSAHIKYATSRGVMTMTFDNVDELHKIKSIAPDAKLVLRILTDDSKSLCRFGVKFGAAMHLVPMLLRTARELQLDIIGISFHVGSGCFDATSFTDAVVLARQAFDVGTSLGFQFSLLDIGGGFPGNHPDGLQFEDIASSLGPCIDELFPANIRVISEPGRYFVSSAYTLAVNIHSRRVVQPQVTRDMNGDVTSQGDKSFMYYVNDGMYGSFNCITFDHYTPKAKPLSIGGKFVYKQEIEASEPLFPCTIWGPTCDSIDLLGRDIMLPELNYSDWFVFEHMGAYTIAAASQFNGFKKPTIVYTDHAEHA